MKDIRHLTVDFTSNYTDNPAFIEEVRALKQGVTEIVMQVWGIMGL